MPWVFSEKRRRTVPQHFIHPHSPHVGRHEAVGLDADPGARIGRNHRNDLENLLIFAILASIYLALAGPAIAAWIYGGRSCLSVSDTRWPIWLRPALRRNCYMLGFLVILALAVHCLLMLARLA